MKKAFSVFLMTIVCLAAIDTTVAISLGWAKKTGRLSGLVRYFDYGRSVPGKLANWQANPGTPGNLFDVGWRAAGVAQSTEAFAIEATPPGIVVRSYGMSFVNNILRKAADADPTLTIDLHAGPAAPPNYTFAMFEDDAANRKPKEVVVLGILSSSVTAMAALSNRTWAFEQPAPYTYPIYTVENGTLTRTNPLISTPDQERDADPELRAAWNQQLRENDHFYSPVMFAATWLDRSPFARLIRRSLAKGEVVRANDRVLSGEYDYPQVIQQMIVAFAETTRRDGQFPVVMLIQTGDPRDPNVLTIATPALAQHDIPYFATVEHFDPTDASGFVADGHYTRDVDTRFASIFLERVAILTQSR